MRTQYAELEYDSQLYQDQHEAKWLKAQVTNVKSSTWGAVVDQVALEQDKPQKKC